MNTDSSSYAEALLRFRNLSRVDKQKFIEEELFDVYREGVVLTLEESQTDRRFAKGRFCPYCRKNHVVRNGTRSGGVQKYMRCLIRGFSLRDAAAYCSIH